MRHVASTMNVPLNDARMLVVNHCWNPVTHAETTVTAGPDSVFTFCRRCDPSVRAIRVVKWTTGASAIGRPIVKAGGAADGLGIENANKKHANGTLIGMALSMENHATCRHPNVVVE